MKRDEHKSVLLGETLKFWAWKPGGFYVDATLGLGGHTEALLASDPFAHCLGLEIDPQALEIAKARAAERFGNRLSIFKESYMNLPKALQETKSPKPDGVLLDLGVSSLQLNSPSRGFSFQRSGPLDMRMDPSQGQTALELIENSSQEELARILRTYGEERYAGPIARALKKSCEQKKLNDTLSCAETVSAVYARMGGRREKIHPATRTFQALRIAVNQEIENLSSFLREAPPLLSSGGRLVLISFHSLEDRMVKESFRSLSRGCTCPNDFPRCVCGKKSEYRILTRKPVRPKESEIAENARSRSAKMRVLERI